MPWDDDRRKLGSRRWIEDTSTSTKIPVKAPGSRGPAAKGGLKKPSSQRSSLGAKFDELFERVEPMIEQVNNLYTMYLQGVERLPPNERRKQLEALMNQMSLMHKPNTTYRFRADTLLSRFALFRDRWDKMMRDLEAGKIKRRVPAKK